VRLSLFAVLQTLKAVAARAGSDLSGAQRIAVAATAGAASSVVSTPCELIIIQQQVRTVGGHVLCFRQRASQCLAACLQAAAVHGG
jgi:hypothetical protein